MRSIEKIKQEYVESIFEEFSEEPLKKTSIKSINKKIAQVNFKENQFTTTTFWNSKEFPVKDTSKVIDINIENRIIVIDSPDTNEIFEIEMDSFKDHARWVKTLIYHPRIHERQGIGALVDEKTKHDHTFPEILD